MTSHHHITPHRITHHHTTRHTSQLVTSHTRLTHVSHTSLTRLSHVSHTSHTRLTHVPHVQFKGGAGWISRDSEKWEVYPYSDQTVQVKRDGSLIMPHSLPDGTGMGAAGFGSSQLIPTEHATYELCFPSEAGLDFFNEHRRTNVWWELRWFLQHLSQLTNPYKQFSPNQSLVILLLRSRRS